MTHIVTHVHHQIAPDASHLHITHVQTRDGTLWTMHEAATSISAGHPWLLSNDGYIVSIRAMDHCPSPNCTLAPYLATAFNTGHHDDLERAPETQHQPRTRR